MKIAIHRNRWQWLGKTASRFMLAAFLVFTAISTFSCDTVFDKVEEPQEQTQQNEEKEADIEIPKGPEYNDKGFLKITVKQKTSDLQQTDTSNTIRTVLPDINISNFSNITLTGIKNGESTTTALGSWANVSALEAAAISLEYGMWTLELRAQNGDFLFTSTRSANISVGQVQSVDFTLSTSETGGGVDFRLNFYDSLMSAQAVTYTLYNSSGTVAQDSGTLEIHEATLGGHRYVRFQRPAGAAGVMMPGFYQIVLQAGRVLVEGDELLVFEDIEGLLGDRGQITPDHQGGGHYAPHREMRLLLLVVHSVADLHHIEIVDVPRRGETAERLDIIDLLQYRGKLGTNIRRSTPGVGDGDRPFAGEKLPADIIDDGLFLTFADLIHDRADLEIDLSLVHAFAERAAPVHLDKVKVTVHEVVLELLSLAPDESDVHAVLPFVIEIMPAGSPARLGVYARLQAERVSVVREGFDPIREALLMIEECAVRRAPAEKAVVGICIDVAARRESRFDEGVKLTLEFLFVDICPKAVPGCPPHDRGLSTIIFHITLAR